MSPARAAIIAAVVTPIATYVSCGPVVGDRTSSSRHGLLAYDYSGDVSPFPPQLLVTALIWTFIAVVLTWFIAAKGRPPPPIRFLSGVVLVMATVAANAGFGGLIGIGAPFILPILWLAARHSGSWARLLWIALATISAWMGSWIVLVPLRLDWNTETMIAIPAVTALVFLLTAKRALPE